MIDLFYAAVAAIVLAGTFWISLRVCRNLDSQNLEKRRAKALADEQQVMAAIKDMSLQNAHLVGMRSDRVRDEFRDLGLEDDARELDAYYTQRYQTLYFNHQRYLGRFE